MKLLLYFCYCRCIENVIDFSYTYLLRYTGNSMRLVLNSCGEDKHQDECE